ncbi:MAG: hypothetical protein ACI9H8_000282 [Lysobacterales bacterium]|jgi:hypothetical protein
MKKLILLFLIPTLVYAEPGPATQYLMNEPASLFDVGMLRLKHTIAYWERQMTGNYKNKSGGNSIGGNVNVSYRPEDDKIYVGLSVMDSSATHEQMEAGCRYALRHIQIYVSKSAHALYQHVGYRDSAEPEELDSSVRDMFVLRCYVSGNDSSKGRFWASQTLGDADMTIGKWPLIN